MEIVETSLAGITLLAAGSLLIVAVIEMVKSVIPEEGEKRNWRTFSIILASAVTGALLAPAMGVEWLLGVYVGLSASGLVKVLK
jgi:hypothetical protein